MPWLALAETQLASSPVASLTDAQVRRQLIASNKKTEHLTEVLRESEANSMRLADQAKLLKEEIRRCVCVLDCMQYAPTVLVMGHVVSVLLHAVSVTMFLCMWLCCCGSLGWNGTRTEKSLCQVWNI